MNRSANLAGGVGMVVVVTLVTAAMRFEHVRAGAETTRLEIASLSTKAALVTGGDVLLQIALPAAARAADVRVRAGSRDVTAAFRAGATANTLVGLVTDLRVGDTTITARAGSATASLVVTNYPITGPVISGPQQQPFICQTNAFKLPDGTTLGPPTDANCSARTVVQYLYKSVNDPPPAPPRAADATDDELDPAERARRRAVPPWWRPMTDLTTHPSDLAMTTTSEGVSVPFIVRVETGTMDRGIYQNAILHDPTSEPPPTPFAPPKGWNRRLLAVHGSGCPSGWYIQGAALGVSVIDYNRLGQGYAVFNNTLNHPTNSCNAFVAGETTMMGKEHFIETFGVPFYTISTGGSGGAYTSLQVADAFPGLIDGVDIRATFPDALAIALSGSDARLLMHYYLSRPAALSEAQVVAISGYHSLKAFLDAANQSQRADPVPGRVDEQGYQSARFNAALPEALRYHPQTNPKGARPTVFDAAKNVYGVNPKTGAALRPFDNTGVQYGLAALVAGVITPAQFLDLNESIGGYDDDANYTMARTAGDLGAIRRAYQTGLMLSSGGGLSSIPILDNATSNETARYHYGWFHFALRERLRQANGSADNMVMWRAINGGAGPQLFDRWMLAYKSDTSNDSQRVKMLRAKPAAAVDGCYDKSTPPVFIADPLPFTSKPTSPCSTLYPVYSNPRREAGGPLSANILKCTLKPVDAKDYGGVKLTAAEDARVKAIFKAGVCDWTKPGINQTSVVTWASLGPAPGNRIGETRSGTSSR